MEQHISILMADLSGYTALTETHGSASAADLIDKYISIAERSLIGVTQMHERTGDEIMFISECPDSLLATALKLEANTTCEENFLMVHGGLHYGVVLKRRERYFGSTINLVSRIASRATPGTFRCSDAFVNSVKDKSACEFIFKGDYVFKNISGEKKVFQLGTGIVASTDIDPVCRMLIINREKAYYHPNGDGIYFCSSQCLKIYRDGRSLTQAETI